MHLRFHITPELKCTTSIDKCIIIWRTGSYAPGLAFVSKVSLSTLGVVEYFHVLQSSSRFSFLGFRDERVVTVRKIYTECNAGFR
jgi:hypothetical protein